MSDEVVPEQIDANKVAGCSGEAQYIPLLNQANIDCTSPNDTEIIRENDQNKQQEEYKEIQE